MRVLTHDKIGQTNSCERSEYHVFPVLCEAYLQEVVIEISPSDHETWSIRCQVGIHKTFHNPLASWASPYFSSLDLAIAGLAHILQALI